MGNKLLHGEGASAPAEDVEPFRQKLNNLIQDEGLLISQVYNADESGLYWRCTPNAQAFKDEKEIHGDKLNKERISFLCRVRCILTLSMSNQNLYLLFHLKKYF